MKEGKNRRNTAFRAVVVGGVLISAAAIALYTPWLGLFGLRTITISGNERVSSDAIGQMADLRGGQPLLSISPSSVSARVRRLPWIQTADVRRIFPDRLRIHVVEREPIAWALVEGDSGCLTVADEGVIVETSCRDRDGLLELVGAGFTGSEAGDRLRDVRLVELIRAVKTLAELDMQFHRIDVSDPMSIMLEAESGLHVLLGDLGSFAQRLPRLVALSRKYDLSEVRRVDLRFEGEATLVTW